MKEMVTKAKDHIIVTAPVLIPDTPDCDYHRGETPLSVKQVADIAHSFMRYGIIDANHDYFQSNKAVGVPVESYILQEKTSLKSVDGSTMEYPKGTWMLSSKITDPGIIEKVEKGELTGYSGTFLPLDTAEKLVNRAVTKASANLRIRDLENPVAYTVSIVNKPCVQRSKFCGISEKGESKMTEESTLEKIRSLLSSTKEDEVAPEYVTKEDFEQFKDEQNDALMKGFEMIVEKMASPTKKEDEEIIEEPVIKSCEKPKKEEEETKEEEKEDEEEDEPPKQSSKSAQVHNPPEEIVQKSDIEVVYEMLDRDATGSKIQK